MIGKAKNSPLLNVYESLDTELHGTCDRVGSGPPQCEVGILHRWNQGSEQVPKLHN